MLTAELNRNRRIGVEHEMWFPRLTRNGSNHDYQQMIADVLTQNGIRAVARGYSHETLPANIDVAVEHDGSIEGSSPFIGVNAIQVEVKTRILNGYDDWERIVPKTLDICKYLGARVNRSTGHHIHLSFDEVRAEPRKIRSLYNVLHRFEPVILGLLPPSRRANRYCRPMPDRAKLLHGCKTLGCFARVLSDMDRYHGLNWSHVCDAAPRVEFRYHSGTLEAAKARHWLRFCLQMVQHAVNRNCQAASKQIDSDRRGLESMFLTCGFKCNHGIYATVSPELRQTGKYLLKRWKALNLGIGVNTDEKNAVAISESEVA